jgi:hypothetical protein
MANMVNPIEGAFDELPAKRPGTVIVAVGSKGAVCLTDGGRLTLGERWFGGYKQFYLVDTSQRELTLTYSVASRRPTLKFDMTVVLVVRVIDPRGAVERGITNLEALFNTSILRAAAAVASKYDVQDSINAKMAVEGRLGVLPIDPAIEIVNVFVDLKPDKDAEQMIRSAEEEDIKRESIAAQGRIDGAGRDIAKDILSSPDDILAQLLTTKDDHYRAALNLRLEQAATEQQRRFEIMKALIDNKIIEPHDIHQRFPGFLDDVFQAMSPKLPKGSPGPLPIEDAKAEEPSAVDGQDTDK